jgi:gliding motility-associatede transport system auxiliary component
MQKIKNLDQGRLAIIAGVLAVILFLAVNVLSDSVLTSARLDLTESRLFTLSDGTREVLGDIDEPLMLRLYASRSLAEAAPAYGDFISRVREQLEHYSDIADGKIRLQVLNPEPYSVEEDEAVAYGLQGIQLDSGGELVYFGLAATNSTDDQEIIPFFDTQRERYLEYDLTRMVFNLANPKKKTVGLMTFIPIDSDPMKQYKPWAIIEQMEQFFEITAIGQSVERFPDDLDLLMIVHPKNVPDKTLYAIEQFILRGGRAMIFVDPHSEVEIEMAMAMRQQPGNTGSDLAKLFDAWGIEFTPEKFIGDRQAATRVEVPSGGRSVITDYVSWIGLDEGHFNPDDVTTSDLKRVFMAAAGYVAKKKDADIEFVPLIFSGERSMRIDAARVRLQPDPAGLLKDFKSEATPFTLAARVSGKFKSAFPDGRPAREEPDAKENTDTAEPGKPELEHIAESAEPVNLIVVADTDMLADRSWLQYQNFFGRQVAVPTANNAAFVINALDNLLGSNALIDLRSRGYAARPFHRVVALRDAADQRYRKTEQGLTEKMRETEEKIGKLHAEDGDGQAILSEDQKTTLANFRSDLIAIRQQLREVQHNLRKDIEALDTWLKILNIWAVPGIICVIAVVMGLIRRQRHRQQAANG